MSARVLLNLLKELEKNDNIRGLTSILFLFLNTFNKFNNTGARSYILFITALKFTLKIVNEYDQEIPQSQTADNPVAP